LGRVIEISVATLSRNQLDSMHWSNRSKYSKNWQSLIYAAFKFKCPKASGKVFLKITGYRPRLLDHDNFIGGCKGVLDAMKRLGIILDDSPDFIEVQYEQRKVKNAETKTVFEFF